MRDAKTQPVKRTTQYLSSSTRRNPIQLSKNASPATGRAPSPCSLPRFLRAGAWVKGLWQSRENQFPTADGPVLTINLHLPLPHPRRPVKRYLHNCLHFLKTFASASAIYIPLPNPHAARP